MIGIGTDGISRPSGAVWVVVSILVMIASVTGAAAEPEGEEGLLELESVALVGSRFEERSVVDSPVPIDVLGAPELKLTGEVELGRVIQELVPSFNFSSSTISDGTDSVRPGTLRGMGPDQVLVLVNGKRRHGSALIHVNTSVGRGTAGTDLNAIPVNAIERIEVLRDGASAQYGSDAVAGVINIVLKDDLNGSFWGSLGQTFSGDGERIDLRVDDGFQVGESGRLHVSASRTERQRTNRAGLTGAIQYADTESIALADWDSPERDALLALYPPDARVILNDPSAEATFDRRNFRVGDAELEQTQGALNYEQAIWNDRGEFYAFGDFSHADNLSGGFYRRANQADRNPAGSSYPDGFLPLIQTTVWDFSGGLGFTREFENGLRTDLSLVHGGNRFQFDVRDSHNASWVFRQVNPGGSYPAFPGETFLGPAPTSADAGQLGLDLTTVNLDFSLPLERVDLAWGVEYKRDRYTIDAGEPYSYLDYDGPSGGVGGIQVFPGFRPENEVAETRNAVAVYGDSQIRLGRRWFIAPGVRAEHYSDFGDTVTGKLSSKWDLSDQFALRGSVSTGFRAPSMHQLFFNNVSTQFLPQTTPAGVTLVPSEVGTFRNDSGIANRLGIPSLDQETSVNISGGVVYRPSDSFSLTADAYQIDVRDRIILSGTLEAGAIGVPAGLSQALVDSGIGAAQFFMNGVDTRTRGLDVVAEWQVPPLGTGDLRVRLVGSLSETSVRRVRLPGTLPGELFGERDRSIIEDWQPNDRITASLTYEIGALTSTLAVHRYGPYAVSEGGQEQTYGAEYLTDLLLSYQVGRSSSVVVGANNLFDIRPDASQISQSRGGTLLDSSGNLIVASPGVFPYSRRTAPFGFNGGYYYLAFEHRF